MANICLGIGLLFVLGVSHFLSLGPQQRRTARPVATSRDAIARLRPFTCHTRSLRCMLRRTHPECTHPVAVDPGPLPTHASSRNRSYAGRAIHDSRLSHEDMRDASGAARHVLLCHMAWPWPVPLSGQPAIVFVRKHDSFSPVHELRHEPPLCLGACSPAECDSWHRDSCARRQRAGRAR